MKKYPFRELVIFVFSVLFLLSAEKSDAQTVGIMLNDRDSYNGYTLLSPMNSQLTYLLDNCGRIINNWNSNYRPGLVAYLLEDGSLLRTGQIQSNVFTGGGYGGIIEKYDWNGNLTWSFLYADSMQHQHHAIEYMPNGNVLILAWEYKSRFEVLQAGRVNTWMSNQLWPEKIVEIQPNGSNGGTVVWEWKAWDHLIQDNDSNFSNYGNIADHPERINLNYMSGPGGQSSDWIHGNSIAYNPVLDQIVISAHNFDEFWVIDHSTTTAEAAGSSGGRYGKGGDLLYRWGNPFAYNRGTAADQMLFGQHDVRWIADTLPHAGSIMLFNNGRGRPGGNYSSIDIIVTPADSSGNYPVPVVNPFPPALPSRTYTGTPLTSFYSSNISGAQMLPNGNIFICEGSSGHFFEVDEQDNIVWDYVNPSGNTGPVSQGSNPVGNSVFRAYRYGEHYAAFEGRTIIPGNPVELNPGPSACIVYNDSLLSGIPETYMLQYEIFPNPVRNQVNIRLKGITTDGISDISILNMLGQSLYEIQLENLANGEFILNLPEKFFWDGLYTLRLHFKELTLTKRIIILDN